MRTTHAFRKHQCRDRDMTLQYPCRMAFYLRRSFARPGPDRARDIGRAVGILRTRIDQVDLIRADRAVAVLGDAVMNDRTMFARAGDSGETFAAKPADRLAVGEQPVRRRHFGFVADLR